MLRRRVADAFTLRLDLDRSGDVAMHRQIYEAFRTAILDGGFARGARLPSTRALAADLGISRTTVLQAFDRLVSEGYATAESGGGTRVATTLPLRSPRGSPARASVGRRREDLVPPRISQAGTAYLGAVKSWRPYTPDVPFAFGLPALDQFPVDTWTRLLTRRWRQSAAELLGYADPCGYRPLREAIAQYAMAARGVRCTPEQVIVVNGAQHGIDMLARLLLDPGDEVWVEEPGYRPVRAALLATGAHLVDVPVDTQGIDIAEGIRRAPNARLVFVTPDYQSPLGVTLSLDRRLALLEWAAHANAWVLEDDYNGEYRYDSHPIPSVQSLDRAGRVIYVGTFSKTLAPGLRIGYLVVPPALVEPVARARVATDRHTAVPDQAVLADFIAGGHFARHVRRTRDLYRARQQYLVDLAPRLTGGLLDVRPAPAGMRVLGILPPKVDSRTVARVAAERGVIVTPVSSSAAHSIPGGRGGVLLGYAAFDEEVTRAALTTLGEVLRTLAPPKQRVRAS